MYSQSTSTANLRLLPILSWTRLKQSARRWSNLLEKNKKRSSAWKTHWSVKTKNGMTRYFTRNSGPANTFLVQTSQTFKWITKQDKLYRTEHNNAATHTHAHTKKKTTKKGAHTFTILKFLLSNSRLIIMQNHPPASPISVGLAYIS